MGKYGRWKNAVEGKGLRMNVECHMQLLFGKKSSVSKVDPCGVYDEQVGCNSIHCMKCQRWVHHHCSYKPRLVIYYHVRMSLFSEHVLVIIVQ